MSRRPTPTPAPKPTNGALPVTLGPLLVAPPVEQDEDDATADEGDPLVPVALAVADELRSADRRITRDVLAGAIRQRRHSVSTDRARALAKLVATG